MSGSRHHILPRILMNGFFSRIKGKSIYVWVNEKGNKPYEVNTLNIGVEKHFYGRAEDNESYADPTMTALENNLEHLFHSMRRTTSAIETCDPLIAEFIAHLVVRTKTFRDWGTQTTGTLVRSMTDFFSEPEHIKKWLLTLMTPAYEKEIEKEFPDIPPGERKSIAVEFIEMQIKGRMDKLNEVAISQKDSLGERLNALPEKMKKEHNKFLAEQTVPEDKASQYKKLNWFVLKMKNEPLILGDVGCVIETNGKRRFKPLDLEADKVINIFLPISKDRLVVGTSYKKPTDVKVGELNAAFAKCSMKYFISSDLAKNALSSKIGQWFGVMPVKSLENSFTEMLEGLVDGTILDR